MISKKEFKNIIEVIENTDKYITNLYDLGIDLLNTTLWDSYSYFSDKLLENNFTTEGVDLINWWLVEPDNRVIIEDEDTLFGHVHVEYKLNTSEDLYDYIINNDIYIKK